MDHDSWSMNHDSNLDITQFVLEPISLDQISDSPRISASNNFYQANLYLECFHSDRNWRKIKKIVIFEEKNSRSARKFWKKFENVHLEINHKNRKMNTKPYCAFLKFEQKKVVEVRLGTNENRY